MSPYEKLLTDTLQEIYDTLITSPQMMEFIHLSILEFNTRPQVIAGMINLDALDNVPVVSCKGATNYAPMFDKVRERIDIDVPNLAEARINVLRPVVFLLTDGEPTDQSTEVWTAALARLTDPAWRRHPHVITYGFGDASETVLTRVATLAAYVAEEGTSNSEALTLALSSMLHSMVTSAQSRQLQIPESVLGMRTLAVANNDYINP
jgi:uncharacterized protein YegL